MKFIFKMEFVLLLQASLWPLGATWAMDINTDPNGAGIMDPDMVPGSSVGQDVTMALDVSAGLSDQHCSSGRVDTNMAPGGGPALNGNRHSGYQHVPWLRQD